ncbi:MAG: CDP-alcohol phosphatidyltransferase family protein [Deltaproteobacteria bacterium]|nr:CDP-alcohol phosphatidyltransferase family protein [Deltaproteobacteria bacterium]MBW2417210.1 CDP-alcohol phosphatidyltransferase family protein [Deltaproteobacteria bacterium]
MASSSSNGPSRAPSALVLRDDGEGVEPALVWGLSAEERLRRGLTRAGAARVECIGSGEQIRAESQEAWVVVRGDHFYDERLIAGLLQQPGSLLIDRAPGDETAVALAAHIPAEELGNAVAILRGERSPVIEASGRDLRIVDRLGLAPAYNAALRKHDPPFIYRARHEDIRESENRIFAASYKGITDFVTKWAWPLPARAVTRRLAARGVKPNSVTALSYVLTALATWFFAEGWFGIGLAAAWLMTFLDTVDGKLARCTLTSSKIGGALDHGLDLVHPPIWWAAWAYGLAPGMQGYELAMWIIVGGYVLGRLLEGIFLAAFKHEIFTWRPFDGFFRTIIARRNPNLVLLSMGVALGRPDAGYIAVAVWTVICNVVPMVRIAQAFAERRRGNPIRPWHEEQAVETGSSEA